MWSVSEKGMSYYGLTKLHKLLPIPNAHLLTTEITSLKTTVCR